MFLPFLSGLNYFAANLDPEPCLVKVTILGSGTSTGIPIITCDCGVCTSNDERDKRLRSSIMVETDSTRIVVDTGPDFRYQMLRLGISKLDSVIFTHYHYDHSAGLDDLRPFSFGPAGPFEVYSDQVTLDIFKIRHPYIQDEPHPTANLPVIRFNQYSGTITDGYSRFSIGDIEIQPIRLVHIPEEDVPSVGFVFNDKVGYITDFKHIIDEDRNLLLNLDTLIIGAPLFKKHRSHMDIPSALELMKEFKPKRGYISHLSHFATHEQLLKEFPDTIEPAYDGLILSYD